jgi:UDP-N-acetylmuramate: L-alanyl-gamma-D-glutamyl-meso-diaminopimelate ligase
MRIHFLGICGTFMAGLASIAKQLGHDVSGCDENVYPPMSTQLEAQGISIYQGYDPQQLSFEPDCVIIGNAMKRGNPLVEYVLNKNLVFYSGPEWLYRYVLQNAWVIAVAGTHGKTTTSGMVAWILEYAGIHPSFLIGGMPGNFNTSARIGTTPFFVIEADEYDTAFFDKRSKFLQYHPRTLIMNNLEYDHADIFENLQAIKTQFHHLVRILPSEGLLIAPNYDENVVDVLERGCFTPRETFGYDNADWMVHDKQKDGSAFTVLYRGAPQGRVTWQLLGDHNVHNALAAIAAARHVGIAPEHAIAALCQFVNAKKRLEIKGVVNDITVYDDFAHHPTAIKTTLAGVRQKVNKQRIFAVLEFSSNTMKAGVHKDKIVSSLEDADVILLKSPEADWSFDQLSKQDEARISLHDQVDTMIHHLVEQSRAGDHIVIMSNKKFDNIHERLLTQLEKKYL